jgi:UDP-N-acetylglucosamine 2-epimerase
MKILSVIGTRPEIIKMSFLFELLNKNFTHKIVHTGQHYDPALDSEIFKQLKLPPVSIRLKTGSGNFGDQLGKQVKALFTVFEKEKPDYVLVQGDTNTALSGALVAARLKIKVIHVEAGCRSGNLNASEEQNRILIDAISTYRFCADQKAFKNLKKEGLSKNSFMVGSTTFDAVKRSNALAPDSFFQNLSLQRENFVLLTLHRAENMEEIEKFRDKIIYINQVASLLPVIFPVHPRTKKFFHENTIKLDSNVMVIPPLKHLEFLSLMKDCRLIITDSGGIQEEAAYFDRPCIILREQTEWTRLVKIRKNFLFKNITDNEMKLTQKLILNDKFYSKTTKIKCPESKPGASKRIISKLKNKLRTG